MGHVRDRWTDPNPAGPTARPKRIRNDRWGKGRRWQARWIENGREAAKAFTSKDAALDWVAEKDAGVVRKHVPTVTVAERMKTWQRSRVRHADSTKEQVETTLSTMILPSIGNRPVALLDREELQEMVAAWTEKWSPDRVRVAWSFVAGMLNQAVADGIIERRPTGIVLPDPNQTPVVPMTLEQVEQIANRMPPWYRAMVALAAASGLRSGELRGLTPDRVKGGVLRVDRQLIKATKAGQPVFGPPKTKYSVRQVTIGADVAKLLDEHVKRWGSDQMVFTSRHGTPIARTTAATRWRMAAEGLGLPERSGWHDLRHYHASLLIAGGMSPVAVAHRLGHKDATETLKTYGHLWPTDEAKMVAVVDAEFAGSSLLARSLDGHG